LQSALISGSSKLREILSSASFDRNNDLVREAPDLAAGLYECQPYDFRGAEPEGAKRWYELPAFTE